jgi:hypothetical protein
MTETPVSQRAPRAPAKKRRPVPVTGADLVAQARTKNRLLALGVMAFMATVFVLVFVAAEVDHRHAAPQPAVHAAAVR